MWEAKHVHGLGRRSGSLALGLTVDQYRYRLSRAEAKFAAALKQQTDV